MESYVERLLGLAKLAAIYTYCVEIYKLNDFRLNRESQFKWDISGHNLVRALHLSGLVDKTLWHDWNHEHYLFYKHPGVADPDTFDLALAAKKMATCFEYPMQHTDQYAKGIIL